MLDDWSPGEPGLGCLLSSQGDEVVYDMGPRDDGTVREFLSVGQHQHVVLMLRRHCIVAPLKFFSVGGESERSTPISACCRQCVHVGAICNGYRQCPRVLRVAGALGLRTNGSSKLRIGVPASPRKQLGGDIGCELDARGCLSVQEVHVRANERRKRVKVIDCSVTNEILEDPNRSQWSYGGHRDGKIDGGRARARLSVIESVAVRMRASQAESPSNWPPSGSRSARASQATQDVS